LAVGGDTLRADDGTLIVSGNTSTIVVYTLMSTSGT
jgi:hypothetical protein